MGRVFFRSCRAKAAQGDKRSVSTMYKQLSGAMPEHATTIRRQLKREYGADPLGDECVNGPVGEGFSAEDIKNAMDSMPA
mmetsp:Transcript_1750/g.5200  ORF Transcript_1750/g.5200 Transcript_1750/m.5200 type:complete len:80 (-) Transcript_1750:286-525(-)